MRAHSSTGFVVSPSTLIQAERQILGCESCRKARADTPFYWVLDSMMSNNPSSEEYALLEPARCPQCLEAVFRDTLVEWA